MRTLPRVRGRVTQGWRRATLAPARRPVRSLPLERAGVRAPTKAGTWAGIYAAFGPGCPWVVSADTCGALGALRGAQALLALPELFENFRAARRRCDWPRPSNLYANEAAPPPRRWRPSELVVVEEGAFALGLGGRAQSPAGKDPRSAVRCPHVPRAKGTSRQFRRPLPLTLLPAFPRPRLPACTTFHPDRL